MRADHRVTKDVFRPSRTFPTIRSAANNKDEVQHADKLPIIKHIVIAPSQPHSKMCTR